MKKTKYSRSKIKTFLLPLILVLVAIPLTVTLALQQTQYRQHAAGASTLGGYSYRAVVATTNTSTNQLTNYPVSVAMNTALLITSGKLRSDCGDLRFTSSDGVTVLPYWIEKGCNTTTTKIWVTVPIIAASNTTVLYAYYGNPSTSSQASLQGIFTRIVPSVVASYNLDEVSGSKTLTDLSGNNLSATAQSTTSVAAGKYNNGRSFNGTSDYVTLPSGFSNFTTGITLESWIYVTAKTNWTRFFDLGNGTASNNIIFGRENLTSNLWFEVYQPNGNSTSLRALNALQMNTWQHVVVTDDASNHAVIYSNGTPVATGVVTLPATIVRNRNYLGKSNWGDPLYKGRMDEVRIYNRSLLPQEVADLAKNYGYLSSADAGNVLVQHYSAPVPSVLFGPEEVLLTSTPTPPVTSGIWQAGDIGNSLPAGSYTTTNGIWTINGGGGDIWDIADHFYYVSQSQSGNGSLSAHVLSQTRTDAWAKAGIMLRQDTSTDAPFYATMVTPDNGIIVEYRTTKGGQAAQATLVTPGTLPVYLRIVRTDSTLTSETSTNGTSWTLIPNSNVTIAFPSVITQGLAVTSHNTTALSTASFDTVVLNGLVLTPQPTLSVAPTATPMPTIKPTATPTPTPITSNFIQVCGTQLCSNGVPFRVRGATAYGHYDDPINEVALAKQENLNTLEVVEYENLYHDLSDTMSEATWSKVDKFIAEAKRNNIRVIINLASYGHALKAAGKDWTDATLWQPLFDFITSRVNTVTGVTYANEPDIAMIELFGEIDPSTNDAAFFHNALAYLKTKDSNHVLSSGGLSYIDYNSGIDWQTIMKDPNNQVCGVEINSASDRNTSVPNVSTLCKQLGKPWFLAAWSSCFGSGDYDHYASDSLMAAHAQDMFAIDAGSAPAAMPSIGSDFWNLGNLSSQVDGTCDIGTQFPLTFSLIQNTAL